MRVVFLRSFEKDVDRIMNARLRKRLLALFEEVQAARSMNELSGIKKLAGHRDAYRIRIGDHRVGIGTVEFARVLHRREIYRMFP
jgi:mRNA interferase RelE/StbE